MKKLTRQAITKMVKYVVKDWLASGQYTDASMINHGDCDEFMLNVIELLGEAGYDVSLSCLENATSIKDFEEDNEPGHYWITWNGWHFDSECPEGVRDYHDLPIFKKAAKALPVPC